MLTCASEALVGTDAKRWGEPNEGNKIMASRDDWRIQKGPVDGPFAGMEVEKEERAEPFPPYSKYFLIFSSAFLRVLIANFSSKVNSANVFPFSNSKISSKPNPLSPRGLSAI